MTKCTKMLLSLTEANEDKEIFEQLSNTTLINLLFDKLKDEYVSIIKKYEYEEDDEVD